MLQSDLFCENTPVVPGTLQTFRMSLYAPIFSADQKCVIFWISEF